MPARLPPIRIVGVQSKPDGSPAASHQFLFVVGLMRSGTTLLYRLLNNHPKIALMYESDLFAIGPLLWPSWRAAAWSERLDFWNGALNRHGVEGKLREALPPQVDGPMEALLALGRTYARRKPEAVYIGSKSIHHCCRLPEIAHALPTARFVVVWRSLADVIDSLQLAGQTNKYLNPARRQRQVFQEYCQLAEGVLAVRRNGHPVHEVRFEELTTAPESACRRLCDFLQLAWSPEMLVNDPSRLSAVPDQFHHFHARNTNAGAVPARTRVIPPRMMAKIGRYERHWAKRFAGQNVLLASRSAAFLGPVSQFFVVEKWMDRVRHRIHQRLRFGKLLVYRFVPLAWLRDYRALLQAPKAMPRTSVP